MHRLGRPTFSKKYVEMIHRSVLIVKDLKTTVQLCHAPGVAMTSGSVWKEQRRFALTVLRDFGMGRLRMEEKIMDALNPFMDYLSTNVSKEVDPAVEISTAVANVIGNIIFGPQYNPSSDDTSRFIRCIDENFRNISKNSLEEDFPVLRLLPGDVCGMKHTMSNLAFMHAYINASLVWHRRSFDGENIRDFTDAYLAKMAEIASSSTETNQGMFDGKS